MASRNVLSCSQHREVLVLSPGGATVSPATLPAKRVAMVAMWGLVLVGCAAPVAVPVSEPGDSMCAELVARLPERLSNQERRTVEPDTGSAAAWGDPPVVLRCGVAEPAALQPDSPLTEINGITWFAEERSKGFVFTSVGLQPRVEVTVPDAYAPEGSVLVQLTPALSAP